MMQAQVSWGDSDLPAILSASQLREWGVRRLEVAGNESAALDAQLLLQHVLGLSREALLREDADVSDAAVALYDALIARRIRREPVAKIIGKRAFWKEEFLVTAATLDPRPDSETLIEAALKHKPEKDTVRSILDLGTGTGCLLLSLLGEYPQARGVGVDISVRALDVARQNARRLGLEERASFLHSDWCAEIEGVFDLIVSNPPYIAESEAGSLMPEVRAYDPFSALFAGVDGLDAYRVLLPQAARHLAKEGVLLLELGIGQAVAVETLAHDCGLKKIALHRDLAGIERVLVVGK